MMVETTSAKSQDEQASPPSHFVYVLLCSNGAFYTGYTTDVAKRFAAHNAGKGARYTRAHLPVTLLVSWDFPNKGVALRAELAIKRLSHIQKARLVEQTQQERFSALPDWVFCNR